MLYKMKQYGLCSQVGIQVTQISAYDVQNVFKCKSEVRTGYSYSYAFLLSLVPQLDAWRQATGCWRDS